MPFTDTTTGATLHYEDMGTGDPVILLHGMLGTAATHFNEEMGWLSREYRVLGPSLRGYGQSTPKPRSFPLEFYKRDAEDVLAFMDALDIEQAHLIGYSDGGESALIAAGLQPERFRSVVTIGAVGYFGPDMRPAVQRMYPVDWVSDDEKKLHSIENPTPIIMQWIRSVKMMIDSGGKGYFDIIERATCPVLMLLGDEDRLNPAAYARVCLEYIANGTLKTFPGGHAVHHNNPEAFRQVVTAFLKSG